jgi:Protein of unknown function (DUF4435)
MTKYSIVDEIDGSTIAGEIAALQADSRKAILVVEGSSDERFFNSFIDHAACSIVISAGWENAIDGLMIVRNTGRVGVLVVLDLDYRAVLGTVQADPDIIFTAEHDIEIAMLTSVALDKVLHELGQPNKIQNFRSSGNDVRELVYSLARPIGALRLYAQENALSLDFDSYDYRHFAIDMTVDVAELIRVIFARSKVALLRIQTVQTSIQAKIASVPDHHLCCGHDACVAFGRSLQAKLGSQNAKSISGELIERSLRLAYGAAEFLNTHLYYEIKAWEGRNHPYRVLRT